MWEPSLAGIGLLHHGKVVHSLKFAGNGGCQKVLAPASQTRRRRFRGHDVRTSLTPGTYVGDRLELRHLESLGFWGVALSALEHAVAHELLEHAQGARLVQAAFVATHGGHAAGTAKG